MCIGGATNVIELTVKDSRGIMILGAGQKDTMRSMIANNFEDRPLLLRLDNRGGICALIYSNVKGQMLASVWLANKTPEVKGALSDCEYIQFIVEHLSNFAGSESSAKFIVDQSESSRDLVTTLRVPALLKLSINLSSQHIEIDVVESTSRKTSPFEDPGFRPANFKPGFAPRR